ncbi:hypothetical protein OG268_14165 [Streptomyces uncialis]|nr:hypothetical protein OG268_14165 [Streptomyces uncialis]
MSGDRKEDAVRRLLAGGAPVVPAGLCGDAVRRGARVRGRRRVVRRVLWLLVLGFAVAFVVWASLVRPWSVPPSVTTPPLTGW